MSKRVLLVEDEPLIAARLSLTLAQMGYDVVACARSASQAVQLAGDYIPDVVLMDIRLEGSVDGIAAADDIHYYFKVPAVFLTAYEDVETLNRIKATSAIGYLVKPINEFALRTTIELGLHVRESQRSVYRADAWLRSTLSATRDALIHVSLEGIITRANMAADRLFCPSGSSLSGCSVHDLNIATSDGTRVDVVELALNEVGPTRVSIQGKAATVPAICRSHVVPCDSEMLGISTIFERPSRRIRSIHT